jgi:hypothetical protein
LSRAGIIRAFTPVFAGYGSRDFAHAGTPTSRLCPPYDFCAVVKTDG